jgi:hypothetical protein
MEMNRTDVENRCPDGEDQVGEREMKGEEIECTGSKNLLRLVAAGSATH